MDEHDENENGGTKPEPPPRPRPESVRIIGADEAAAALDSGQAAGRRPEDEPRYGDVPPPPAEPRPGYRFPLPESVDPAEAVPRPPVAGSGEQASPFGGASSGGGAGAAGAAGTSGSGRLPSGPAPEMPHWTEPATGEVPSVLGGERRGEEDDLSAWSGFSSREPRWRDQQGDWAEADFDSGGSLADDETRLGALDQSRTEHSDLYSFDEEPGVAVGAGGRGSGRGGGDAWPTTSISSRPAGDEDYLAPQGSQRDVATAIGTGVVVGVLALVLFKLGPAPSLALALVAVTLAAIEVFDVLRRAGYRPATLLGLTATVSIMIAAYNKGETAIPLVLALTVVFCLLWYLVGVARARPTVNVAVTLLGFMWVGFLGSFAALILNPSLHPHRRGVAFLLGAVIATVAYDVGAFVFGSQFGRRPLAPEISPQKTWEGLIGGAVAAVFFSLVVVSQIHPWSFRRGFALGLVVAIVAPLGDLCESMVKRDLGVKDMGALLPGHGGVLDRMDALLFVLPATYYLVRLLKIG